MITDNNGLVQPASSVRSATSLLLQMRAFVMKVSLVGEFVVLVDVVAVVVVIVVVVVVVKN